MKCLYCGSDDHPWFNCRKRPEGWKPPKIGATSAVTPEHSKPATRGQGPEKSTAARKDAPPPGQGKRGSGPAQVSTPAGTQARPVDHPRIEGAKFVAYVPEGTQLLSYGNRVLAAGPGLVPSIVTKDGLVPITMPLDQMKKGGRPRTRTPEEWKAYKADKERQRREDQRAEKAQKEGKNADVE